MLIFACQEGHDEVVKMLLGAGVDKDAADEVGCRVAGQAHGVRAAVFITHSARHGVAD